MCETRNKYSRQHVSWRRGAVVIAKEIVDLHGGEIEVDSQLGEGTTFTVDPIVKTPKARQPGATDSLREPASGSTQLTLVEHSGRSEELGRGIPSSSISSANTPSATTE